MKRVIVAACLLLCGCLAYADPTVTMQTGGDLDVFEAPTLSWATKVVDFDDRNDGLTYTDNYAIADCRAGTTTCAPYNWENQWKAPTGDVTQYISTPDPVGGENIGYWISGFEGANYFGMYWGSFDSYNRIRLYYGPDEGGAVGFTEFDGTQAAALFGITPNGAYSGFVNFFAPTGNHFTEINVFSSQMAFESDYHIYGITPEPASMVVFGTGLLGAGLIRRFRKKA